MCVCVSTCTTRRRSPRFEGPYIKEKALEDEQEAWKACQCDVLIVAGKEGV